MVSNLTIKNVKFLIDTGANFSALNSNVLLSTNKLSKCNINCITATKEIIKLKGEVNLNFTLNNGCNVKYNNNFIVSDHFNDEFIILVTDFLKNNHANIDFRNNKLYLAKYEYNFVNVISTQADCTVRGKCEAEVVDNSKGYYFI